MQQDQPQYYTGLMGHLSAEDQNTLQNVMAQADLVAAKQQAEAAAAAQAPNAANPAAAS